MQWRKLLQAPILITLGALKTVAGRTNIELKLIAILHGFQHSTLYMRLMIARHK